MPPLSPPPVSLTRIPRRGLGTCVGTQRAFRSSVPHPERKPLLQTKLNGLESETRRASRFLSTGSTRISFPAGSENNQTEHNWAFQANLCQFKSVPARIRKAGQRPRGLGSCTNRHPAQRETLTRVPSPKQQAPHCYLMQKTSAGVCKTSSLTQCWKPYLFGGINCPASVLLFRCTNDKHRGRGSGNLGLCTYKPGWVATDPHFVGNRPAVFYQLCPNGRHLHFLNQEDERVQS